MANIHPNAEKKILIIGSFRIHGLEWRKQTGFNLKVFSKGGLTYAELIDIVNSKICDEKWGLRVAEKALYEAAADEKRLQKKDQWLEG